MAIACRSSRGLELPSYMVVRSRLPNPVADFLLETETTETIIMIGIAIILANAS